MRKTKRADLVKLLEKNGWYLKRNGGGHDIYTNGIETETIPRHKEVKENLARAIIKKEGTEISLAPPSHEHIIYGGNCMKNSYPNCFNT